jgi:hypothetical protein
MDIERQNFLNEITPQPFKLKYDTQVEVSQKAFDIIMNQLAGTCAGREESGKFFIKCFMMGYKKEIKAVIKAFPI